MAYLQMREGRKLYYEEEGSGKPVVMIHGWKASADVYADTSSKLAATGNYRCIRYDQCGHMRSEVPAEMPTLATLAEDLHEIITQLQLETPILVGWSMGGMTILEYIRRYGCEHLDRVVIVDITPRSLTGDGWPFPYKGGTLTVEDAAAQITVMQENFHEYMRQYYTVTVPGFAADTVENQDARIAERMVGHDSRVLTSLWGSFILRDHRDVLPRITCPTAIFHADLMPACSADVAEYYVEHISGPTVKVCFENASHALITEQPERFAEELLQFFAMH